VWGATIAEMINSIALVLIYNSITKFTGTWFGQLGRVMSTALIIGTIEISREKWILNLLVEPNEIVIYESIISYGTAVECMLYMMLVSQFFRNDPIISPTKS